MKARVIDPERKTSCEAFDVSFISVDTAAGIDINTGEIIAASFDDVEFIYDFPFEEDIIKHREIFSIRKPREASFVMYSVILKCMEEYINREIECIVIINDVDSKNKRVWVKHINAAVNGIPISIDISGKKYNDVFDIKVSDVNKEEFLSNCKKEARRTKNGLKLYTKRLNGLMYTIKSLEGEQLYTSTLELNESNKQQTNTKTLINRAK